MSQIAAAVLEGGTWSIQNLPLDLDGSVATAVQGLLGGTPQLVRLAQGPPSICYCHEAGRTSGLPLTAIVLEDGQVADHLYGPVVLFGPPTLDGCETPVTAQILTADIGLVPVFPGE